MTSLSFWAFSSLDNYNKKLHHSAICCLKYPSYGLGKNTLKNILFILFKSYNSFMEKLVEIKDLNMYYPIQTGFMDGTKEYLRALTGVNLDIYKGEILGLVGESGCGKSTLGKAVLNLIKPEGEVLYEGENVLTLNRKDLKRFRKKAQLIFQNPFSSLDPRMTVYNILREPLVVHGIRDKNVINSRIHEIISHAGLDDESLKRYPHEFSGGQRQRIAIARALILKPDFLVADEPVSALDVSIQAQIITLLKELKDKLNLTILFISHDLGVVKYLSDRIAVMYLGDIVELSDADELFKNPKHPYTKALISAVPSIAQKPVDIELEGDLPSPKNPPLGCKFHTRCPMVMEICSQKEPEIKEVSGSHCVKCHLYD